MIPEQAAAAEPSFRTGAFKKGLRASGPLYFGSLLRLVPLRLSRGDVLLCGIAQVVNLHEGVGGNPSWVGRRGTPCHRSILRAGGWQVEQEVGRILKKAELI